MSDLRSWTELARGFQTPQLWLFVLLFCTLSVAAYDCSTVQDQFVGDAQTNFQIIDWIYRGLCIRAVDKGAQCYQTLETVLESLKALRMAEYNGAAGVLALLPTIGALLGAPTSEIWRLITLYPMGGILAMFLSFGGAIMPVDVEDYEQVMSKKDATLGSIVSFRKAALESDTKEQRLDHLLEKIRTRVNRPKGNDTPKKSLLPLGILWMMLLLAMAQFGMAVVEQGSLIPWWCVSTWWMHLWYFLVTLTTIIENWAQLPFIRQHRFFISYVPYKIDVTGGERVLAGINKNSDRDTIAEEVKRALPQLKTLRAASVINKGSFGFTTSRCSVTVLVSIMGTSEYTHALRLFSKAASITVFVCGTAIFAAVTLLSLEAAIMILTLILSAGIFGRGLASGMVNLMSKDQPLFHVIAEEADEAMIIARLLQDSGEHQIELKGNIFIEQQRVATRSPWRVRMMGIVAKPYDLLKVMEPPEVRESRAPEGNLAPPQLPLSSFATASGSPGRYSRSPRSRLLDWEEEQRKSAPPDFASW